MRKTIPSIRLLFASAAILVSTLSVRAEPVEDLIKCGDACDVKLQPTEALKYYLPAEKLHPKDGPLLVCIARQYRHLMSDATTNDEKLRLGHIALSYSQRAAAAAPQDSEAQLAPAITYGKMLPFEGKGEQIASSRHIKESADKALKINPDNDLAWHVLGRWYRVLADVGSIKRALAGMIYGELPAAKNEDALKCFEKAIALNPHRPMHFIELGHTYVQMGRSAEAKRCLSKGLAMTNTEKDDPELKMQGRELLAQLR